MQRPDIEKYKNRGKDISPHVSYFTYQEVSKLIEYIEYLERSNYTLKERVKIYKNERTDKIMAALNGE